MQTSSSPTRGAADRIAIDTGPLVALTRAEALDVVGQLPLQFVCPPQVRAGLDHGTGPDYYAVVVGWLTVVPLAVALDPIATATLDAGEAAVSQLVRGQGIDLVCMDDRKGRRAAVALGLRATGSLGLLARAKILGLTPTIRPFITRAMRHGIWYDAALVRLLAELGE